MSDQVISVLKQMGLYAAGAAFIAILLYLVYEWIKRDFMRQCPRCKQNGVLEKVDDQLYNKRQFRHTRTVFEGSQSHKESYYKTTEYWRATYECSGCGHSY